MKQIFWKIIMVLLFWNISLYVDNKQQWTAIFKNLDLIGENASDITDLSEAVKTNQEAIIKILS